MDMGGQGGGVRKGWAGGTSPEDGESLWPPSRASFKVCEPGEGRQAESWVVSLCEGDLHAAKVLPGDLTHSRYAGTGREIQSHQLGIT